MGGVLHDDDAEPARACELVGLQQVPVLDPRTKAPPGLAAAGLERGEHRVDRGIPDGMHHRLVPGGADTLVLYVRGRTTNSAAPLYIGVEDASGKSAEVAYPETMVVKLTKWAEWKVPLSEFTGVNMARVKRLYLGVGDKAASAAGGQGLLYIDDIRLAKPVAAQ